MYTSTMYEDMDKQNSQINIMIIPPTPKEYVNLMKTNITLLKKIFSLLLFPVSKWHVII